MWSPHNFLANVQPEDRKYMCASCGYRGNLPTAEVDDEISKDRSKNERTTLFHGSQITLNQQLLKLLQMKSQ